MKSNYKISLLKLIAALTLVLNGCASDPGPTACNEWDFDCYADHANINTKLIVENINFWSRVNIIGSVCAFSFGVLATLMIALQGDANKRWTRPIGIIATTLVTGIGSALVNFHVQDNVDKLISLAGNMANLTSEFGENTGNLAAGRDKASVENAYKTDKEFREKTNKLVREFGKKQNDIKMEMMRIKGTAARLNFSEGSKQKNP